MAKADKSKRLIAAVIVVFGGAAAAYIGAGAWLQAL